MAALMARLGARLIAAVIEASADLFTEGLKARFGVICFCTLLLSDLEQIFAFFLAASISWTIAPSAPVSAIVTSLVAPVHFVHRFLKASLSTLWIIDGLTLLLKCLVQVFAALITTIDGTDGLWHGLRALIETRLQALSRKLEAGRVSVTRFFSPLESFEAATFAETKRVIPCLCVWTSGIGRCIAI